MPAKLVRTLISLLAVLTAASTACVTIADDGPFSLTAEITRRFDSPGDGKLDAAPLAKSMLNYTQSILQLSEPFRLSSRLSFRSPRISLNDELTLEREPTHVESQIAAGFPDGRTTAVGAHISVPEGGAVPIQFDPLWRDDTPTEAPQKGWSGMTLAVRGMAMRFVDEGAALRR